MTAKGSKLHRRQRCKPDPKLGNSEASPLNAGCPPTPNPRGGRPRPPQRVREETGCAGYSVVSDGASVDKRKETATKAKRQPACPFPQPLPSAPDGCLVQLARYNLLKAETQKGRNEKAASGLICQVGGGNQVVVPMKVTPGNSCRR